MELLNTSLAAATLLFACLCFHLFKTYWKLKNVPGPFFAKFTNLQRVLWVKTFRSQEIYQDIHEKYGDIVRTGPDVISISNPAAIPTVYPTRPGFPKGKFYQAFMPYTKKGSLPSIFTSQDEQLHKQLKSPIASLFNLSNVVTFECFVDEVLGVLFEQLDSRFVGTDRTCDLGDWLQYFAFDVMGTMTFSSRYGFLETGKDVGGMIGSIWSFMLTVGPMTQIPWFDKLWNKNAFSNMFKQQKGSPILKVVADKINERQLMIKPGEKSEKEKTNQRKDFLSCYLDIQASSPSTPPWALTAWTFSNVIAGSDSTAVTMRTVIYNVLSHPITLKTLLRELRTSNLSRPYPSWNEVRDLPFLDACVQEAVRLHPPFCLPLERIVPAGGVTICGQYFRKGTVVGMNPYVVNRHKPTFGEDAEEWRPERWLGLDEEQRRKMEASVMTFGAGRRVCLGKYVALLEIKKIVPALLLNYEMELLDPTAYTVENSYFFRQKGIDVKFKKVGSKSF